ncbi:MAG: sulfite exporter TauE/SafE family protein [Candidatus Koribacter versatilis]|uniref:Probable membrane transporter protein n=1 Tax=Candidatus Korobacter versatilis TaxID=658062 RepID=A0A932A7C5_9BACT|nr:sulfite exporter TauE/SafE family protein [Candidatus Koribacter versatilis]
MLLILGALLAGLGVGVFSGLIGVGGGVIAVPILVYAFGMEQKMAQGTSLMMLLGPTGAFAIMEYYRAGNVNLKVGLLMAVGVLIGAYFGGHWAQTMSNVVLRRTFAVILAALAIKMFLQK